jgi:hypothetical protein
MKSLPTIDELRARAKAYGSDPYWFGLGFVQLKLSDTERMHFWSPEIPYPEREEIHNHRYDFTSNVLAGAVHHETFLVMNIFRDNEDALHEIFTTTCMPGVEGTVEEVTPCDIRPMGAYIIGAGSTYSFPHTSFHTTKDTKFAITHLTRVLPKPLEFASVVKLRGAATVCPFKEKLPTDVCWEHIASALGTAENE